jgi:tetratricopeptide (TPR) repeat protein
LASSPPERPHPPEPRRNEAVAGTRYSIRSEAEEVVWNKRTAEPGASAGPKDIRAEKGEPLDAQRTPKIRSGRPPPGNSLREAPLTPFEIASLLDQGQFREALQALGEAPADEPADRKLMRARALVGAQYRPEALATLERVVKESKLDPDTRAAAARLLVELGEVEQGLKQARLAVAKQPNSPLVQLTRAWAAVRLGRRTGKNELFAEAERSLAGLKTPGGPQPVLLFALRACIEAQVGDAERALGVAQRALALDAMAPDALAAIALASARLGRRVDAEQASLRLAELAPEEATALASLFDRMGLHRGDRTDFGSTPPAQGPLWDPSELAWLEGRYEAVVQTLERACRERLSELAEAAEEPTFTAIATAGARLLTTSPVWANFAPYDFSVGSLERVRCGLELLYGKIARLRLDHDNFPVQVLVGAYLGETVSRVYGARWEGSIGDPDALQVVRHGGAWSPLKTLGQQLSGRAEFELGLPPGWRVLQPRIERPSRTPTEPIASPCPWDPEEWPNPADIPALAGALKESVISSYCARYGGGKLDGSVESLGPLDAYLGLLAPERKRVEPAPAWARRAAVLCGGYLGEILRVRLGGRWLVPHDSTLGPESYCLRLGNVEAAPVAMVLARLTGRNVTPIHEHAARLLGTKP